MIEHCEIAGETEHLWLIHEYVRGRTLAELVLAEPERKRDPAWLLGILAELAAVLAYLHEQSPAMAHGQISASSILVGDGQDLRVCLLDLQLSQPASPLADLRALGSLLVSWDANHVDSQLASLIERMLAEDPERQITSAELREAVAMLIRLRGYEDRRSPPTLALTRRPTPRFVRIEQVQGPDGSVSQASHPVPPTSSRAAGHRGSGDVPIMRPDELSRELSQAHHASVEQEQQEQRAHKQLAFARVAVALLVALITGLVTYLAMH
jgi:serine/threonine protein kinase